MEIIEDSAFRDSEIRSVTIGTGVTTIGDSVFEYCDQFTTVHYTGTPEMFEAIQVDEEDNDIFFSADVHYMDADDVKEASSVPTRKNSSPETSILLWVERKSGMI